MTFPEEEEVTYHKKSIVIITLILCRLVLLLNLDERPDGFLLAASDPTRLLAHFSVSHRLWTVN